MWKLMKLIFDVPYITIKIWKFFINSIKESNVVIILNIVDLGI